jgi:drug/metabolite transporter (DMT)-like permease
LTPAALPLLWVPITVSAAFVQNIRSAGQKHLAGELNTMSVTMVRFMFGLPFGLLYVGFLQARTTDALPRMAAGFLGMVAMAGLAQIIGTGLLIYLFSLRNFAVGNAYARTEAVLTAVLGTLFFGETVARFGWAAILISVCGVLLITVARARLRGPELVSMLKDKAPWIGLLVGLGFSLTSLSLRRATLVLGLEDVFYRAALTMIAMVSMQAVVMGIYVAYTDPGQFRIIVRNWRACLLVGGASVCGTVLWATAFTLEQAANVKALAQIEIVFALASSYWLFRERSTPKELAGIALIVVGIVLLVLSG